VFLFGLFSLGANFLYWSGVVGDLNGQQAEKQGPVQELTSSAIPTPNEEQQSRKRYGKTVKEAEIDRLVLSDDQNHEFFDHRG
jgi:hypothetical protein